MSPFSLPVHEINDYPQKKFDFLLIDLTKTILIQKYNNLICLRQQFYARTREVDA